MGDLHDGWAFGIGAQQSFRSGRTLFILYSGEEASSLLYKQWCCGKSNSLFRPKAQSGWRRSSSLSCIFPNPFLTGVTLVAALGWCWIYSRHSNLLPLVLSHAVGTLGILHCFDTRLTGGMRVAYSSLQLWLE